MNFVGLVLILAGYYLVDSFLKNRRPVEAVKAVAKNPAGVRAALASTAGYKTPTKDAENSGGVGTAIPDATGSPATSKGLFVFPTATGKVGSKWGMRMHPIEKRLKLHNGVDIGAPTGTPIYAAIGGTVTRATMGGYNGGSGNNVRINHGSILGQNLETAYLHMSSIAVKAGDKVTKGQVIGAVGSTGLSTAPHLHFAVYVNGKGVDPQGWLEK